MKRIGVISDTHIPKAATDIPKAVYDEFQNVDMILHAGDMVVMEVFEKLKNLAPTYAVSGNMDMPDVKQMFPEKNVIKVEGVRIGLIHGYGPISKLTEVLAKEFTRVSVVVFGHSHVAMNEIIKKTLFFNPGSPTDKIFAAYNSFGILEVADGKVCGKIIRL